MQTTDQITAQAAMRPVVTTVQGVLLSLLLVVIFTPFESPGSYISVLLPRFAVLLAIFLLAPSIFIKPVHQIRPAFVLLLAVLIHMTVFVPTDPMQLIAEWVGLIGCAFLARTAVTRKEAFLLGVRIALVINILTLAAQAVVSGIQGGELDLHALLFPVSETRTGGETFGGFIRNGGIHIEPGTYATWVAMLLTVARLLAGKFRIVEWAAMASLLPTYSTAAAVYFAIFVLWNLLDAIGSKQARSLAFVTVLVTLGGIAFTSLGVDRYLEARYGLERNEEEQQWRAVALAEYQQLSIEDKLLGFGHTRELCDDCHFDDLGFGPNLLLRGGLLSAFGLLVLIWGLVRLLGLNNALLTLLVVGTAKASTNTVAPWIVLLVASEVGLSTVKRSRRRRRR